MNYMKTTLLLGVLTGILILFGNILGGHNGAFVGLVMAAVMNLVSYWFSDKIVLAMYRAKQVGPDEAPELYRIVRELSERNGMPMPKVYVIPEEAPNAFATGRNPRHASVAATVGILRMLDEKELEGVMAHELAHVRNRDILIASIAATLAGAITYIAHMAQYALMFAGRGNDDEEGHGNIVGSILMMVLAPIAAMLIQMAISRSREYAADETGARMCGKPLSLARALEKIHAAARQIPFHAGSPSTAHLFIANPFGRGGFVNLFSTHPPMEERVKRLEELARKM